MSYTTRTNSFLAAASRIALMTAIVSFTAQAKAQSTDADDQPSESSIMLEVITVTAQKRVENAQDVPIAINNFGGDFLKRSQVTRIEGLAAQIPSLSINSVYGQTRPSFFMRGIGLDGFTALDGNSVAVTQDEVVLESRAGSLSQLYDVERIEVLRGPQGTLFGRNATAGAINIFSRLPDNEFEGNFGVTVGNFGRFEVEGGVSIPLVEDKLAVRVAGQMVDSDGAVFNEFNGENVEGENRWAGRAIFLFTPTDMQTWTLNIAASDSDNDGGTFFQIGALPDGSDFLGYMENSDPSVLSNDQGTFERTETFRVSLKGEIELGSATLTSISGYNEVKGSLLEDSDASPANLLNALASDQTDQFTQELRLSGENNRFTWVVGGFYFKENVEGTVDLFLNLPLLDPTATEGLGITQVFEQDSSSYAIFGQVDVPLGDIFTATAGLRWTNDKRDFTQDVIIGAPAFNVGGNIDDDQLTWRAALTAEPTEDLLFYGSYSRGYRAGQPAGLALLSPAEFGLVDAEIVDTYEIGFKSEFANRRVQINGAAFYNKFDNLQVVDFAPAGDGSGLNSLFLRNAEAKTYGVEIDAVIFPTEFWRIDASGSWLKSEYDSLSVADKLTGLLTDVSGQPLVNAPEFSFNIATEYELVTEFGSFIPRIEVVYTGKHALKVSTEQDLFTQGSYTLLNLSAIYRPNDADWEVQVWGRNVTDEDYLTELIDVRDLGFIEARRGTDTTYGATLRVNF